MPNKDKKLNIIHTPETVMNKLVKCETEVGQQMEALRSEVQVHKDAFDSLRGEWDTFVKDFAEMLKIFRSAKGFFTVLGWIGKGARWIALAGIAIGTIIAGIKSGIWK